MFLDLWEYVINHGSAFDIAIKLGKDFLAVFTWIGALAGAVYSLKDITTSRRNKQLSEFIPLFSAENEIKRLSGIYGLSSYSKFLFRELFFICSIEKDAIIKELIYDALQKQSPHSKKYCIQINDFLVNYFLQHNYQSKYFNDIKNNGEMMDILKDSGIDRRIEFEINQKNPSSIFEQDYAVDNHLMLSSRLLASAMKRSFFVKLSGNLMVRSDMYASKWRYVFVQNCVLVKNVSRHIFFNAVRYKRCYIFGNNYYDSKFIATYFIKCTIKDCLFLDSFIRNTIFGEGKIQHIKFDKSTLKRCRFSQLNVGDGSSWNGCRILNCKYEEVQMTHNIIKGTDFVAVCFMGVKFWASEFIGEFKKCRFSDVVWGGSILSGVRFRDCILENVDFAGARLKNCKFVNCTINNTNFEKMKDDNTDFIDCRRD